MCGIVGYVGTRNATPILTEGLRRLEYRGYDSAGIAVLNQHGIELRRSAGKLENLVRTIEADPIEGLVGIGHTRWATHGEPSQRNAHPHLGHSGEVVLVHNGIVENYLELRAMLAKDGIQFHSDTDSEIIVHLVEQHLDQGHSFKEAARRTIAQLEGSHGIVLLYAKEPDVIFAARVGNAGGVVLGIGEGEMFVASDIPAILSETRKMAFLEPEQMALVTREGFAAYDLHGEHLLVDVVEIDWDAEAANKAGYPHYMLKEIHEQVRSINDTIAGRIDFAHERVQLPELKLDQATAKRIKRIIITACGTAAHAGQVGKILIEKLARIPTEVDIASEFRYRDPIVDADTVVLAISQSGETADTLAAMNEGRKRGAILWSIVNAIGSQAMRISDGFIGMQTGPEIGVASTKAFTAPLVDLYMLALLLGDLRGTLSPQEVRQGIRDLLKLPELVSAVLDRSNEVEKIAVALKNYSHCLYIGRGINMPIAYEGALKLKEISYIHAEAYPAGEMKHGPIALIDESMPVIAIAPSDPWYEKMLSQIEQTRARGGLIVTVATDGDERMASLASHVLWIPAVPWMLSPVATTIPLQLLAYYIARLRGEDIDQPRNLAKSVTVE
ncbi:MAG: glutamine--fructose-6-phosphate transaminase (isomerizing) [Anaerolineales bacterium]|nr:glutamine--fructose-6-phosphate transaminase (isomerizing) [Anaerolineales bacterium]